MTTTRTPAHGTTGRYKGTKTRRPCRCRRCVAAHTRAGQIRELNRLNGRPGAVDPAPVTAHIRTCLDHGMSYQLIARLAGVAASTVGRFARGNARYAFRDQAERILAVQPGQFDNLADRPAIGATRRIRGLYAAGHGPVAITKVSTLCLAMVTDLAGGKYQEVSAATDETVRRATRILSGTIGSSTSARNRAAREGWAPLAAWDNIDDPNAQPETDEPETHLSFIELGKYRRQEIDHLDRFGIPYTEIAERLGMGDNPNYVRDIVRELRKERLTKPAARFGEAA